MHSFQNSIRGTINYIHRNQPKKWYSTLFEVSLNRFCMIVRDLTKERNIDALQNLISLRDSIQLWRIVGEILVRTIVDCPGKLIHIDVIVINTKKIFQKHSNQNGKVKFSLAVTKISLKKSPIINLQVHMSFLIGEIENMMINLLFRNLSMSARVLVNPSFLLLVFHLPKVIVPMVMILLKCLDIHIQRRVVTL